MAGISAITALVFLPFVLSLLCLIRGQAYGWFEMRAQGLKFRKVSRQNEPEKFNLLISIQLITSGGMVFFWIFAVLWQIWAALNPEFNQEIAP